MKNCISRFAVLFFLLTLLPCYAADFVKVADFPYGTWGTTVWNGRMYVGFYVGHDYLPLYRSGVNNDSFSFVRNMGRGESIPKLWVSPDNTTLHLLTEGLSGSEQSPSVHWYTTDSANAQTWSSDTYGSGSTYRWGLASLVHGSDMYMALSSPHVPAQVRKWAGGTTWNNYGPSVTSSDPCIILEMQMFNGQLYAGGGQNNRWSASDCGRVFRYNSGTNSWDQVFDKTDGLIGCSAVFDGKLWVGTVWGTKIYSTTNGTTWTQEYNFGMTGSWPGVDAMIIYKNKLYAACTNGDNLIKIVERPIGGSFTQVYSSSLYKANGDFVLRGDDLYLGVEKTSGGGAMLKYTAPTDLDPPSVPTNVTATAQSESAIHITWTASTDNVGVVGYKIFRNGAQVGTSTTTSFTNTGLSPATTYSYTVSAYDGAGNESAQSSPPAVATTHPPDTEPPSIPTNVTATAQSTSSISVTWTASSDNVGVAGYKVFRNGAQVGTSATTSFTDTGLSAGTTYSYTVSAYDGAGNESAQSSPPAIATTHPPDVDPPSVPTNVAATAQSSSSINVTWTASTDNVGVTGYKIFRNGNQVGTSSSTSYLDTGLSPSTTYSYTAAAYDAAGNASAQSSPPATATTLVMAERITIYQEYFDTDPYLGTPSRWLRDDSYINWTSTSPKFIQQANPGIKCYRYTYSNTPFSTAGFGDVRLSFSYSISGGSTTSVKAISAYVKRPGDPAYPGSAWPSPWLLLGVVYYTNGIWQTQTYDITATATAVSFLLRDEAGSQTLRVDDVRITGVDIQPPNAPSNVTTAVQFATVQLSWNASTDNVGVAGYRVFRNGNEIGTTATPGYVDVDIAPGYAYSYTVSAYDAAGNGSSQSSPAAVAIVYLPADVATAKQLPDGLYLSLPSDVVTAVYSDSFYVGEIDRFSGIKIVPQQMPVWLAICKLVNVDGLLVTSNGERQINGISVSETPTGQ